MTKHILQAFLEDESDRRDVFAHPTKYAHAGTHPALAYIHHGKCTHNVLPHFMLQMARILVEIREGKKEACEMFPESLRVLREDEPTVVQLLLELTAFAGSIEVEENPGGKSYTVCFRLVPYHFAENSAFIQGWGTYTNQGKA